MLWSCERGEMLRVESLRSELRPFTAQADPVAGSLGLWGTTGTTKAWDTGDTRESGGTCSARGTATKGTVSGELDVHWAAATTHSMRFSVHMP